MEAVETMGDDKLLDLAFDQFRLLVEYPRTRSASDVIPHHQLRNEYILGAVPAPFTSKLFEESVGVGASVSFYDDGAGMAETVDRLMEEPLKTLDNVKDTINVNFEKAGVVDPNAD